MNGRRLTVNWKNEPINPGGIITSSTMGNTTATAAFTRLLHNLPISNVITLAEPEDLLQFTFDKLLKERKNE